MYCYFIYIITTLFSIIIIFQNIGKVLLQTTPISIKGKIEKSLREIVTYEGVLECNECHFWTMSPNMYVGTILIRAHRNANESELLIKIYSLFHSFITHLTVQIEKDPDIDWFLSPTSNTEFVPIKTTPTQLKRKVMNDEQDLPLTAVIEETSDIEIE